MLTQDKCTIYRYSAGGGYYYILEVQDCGFVDVYIFHGKVLLPMFCFGIHLTSHTNINKILTTIESKDTQYKEMYKGYIKESRVHYIKF